MGEFIDKTKDKIKHAFENLTSNKWIHREGQRDDLKGQVKGVVDDAMNTEKGAKKSVDTVAK